MKKNVLEKLKNLGLTRDQLRSVAGGMRANQTSEVTSAGVTKCCW